jgi:phosphoribosyl 1,2-cyclic phosphodiesterase
VTLTFLGTRGYIDERSRRHRLHSTLQIVAARRAVLIDCGEDWLARLEALSPAAIVITHAHPDHAGGLRRGAPCPVYTTAQVWETMPRWNLPAREVLRHERMRVVCGLRITPFPVVHSLRAPAVGYRISAGGARLFYVPDVVSIPREREALSGVDLYVGDGATLTRPILRTRDGTRIGHIPIREQLVWCGRQKVPRALFTHCGSQIVRGDGRSLATTLAKMGRVHGVEARFAHDGMRLVLPSR